MSLIQGKVHWPPANVTHFVKTCALPSPSWKLYKVKKIGSPGILHDLFN